MTVTSRKLSDKERAELDGIETAILAALYHRWEALEALRAQSL